VSAPAILDTAGLADMIHALTRLDDDVEPAERIDRIRLLEDLKSAAGAAQARETVAFAAARHAEQLAAGVPEKDVRRGIAGEVGLARRVSPFHAQRYVGWARILTTELPTTFAALQAGEVSEWRAMIVARETAWLSAEHRGQVDAALAPQLESLGDRRLEAETRRIAYRLDPEGCVARFRTAPNERHVTIRPAPDAMVRLSALLPAPQGVACYASLAAAADTHTAAGDERGRGQLMADTLTERLTGQTSAEQAPVTVNLILSDQTLLAGGDEPGVLEGLGPIPAPIARDLAIGASESAPRWLRRLYTHPSTGQLVAMESTKRCFPKPLRSFVQFRDRHCRTPYCNAPIRHTDHITPATRGGPTSVVNGQGTCQTCNYTKQAPGWHTRLIDTPAGSHEVETTTPTGHHYRSRAPDPPRPMNGRLDQASAAPSAAGV
jgi:Domain of unknown function (DUF222)/HNH endonuclease